MQQIIDALATFAGAKPEELAAQLYKQADDGTPTVDLSETAGEVVLDLISNRLKALKDESERDAYDKGHKEGKFSALSQAEQDIAKAYGVEGKRLPDIVSAIAKKAAEAAASEDAILTHPLFINTTKKYEEEIKAKEAEAQKKIAEALEAANQERAKLRAAPVVSAAIELAGVDTTLVRPQAMQAFLAAISAHGLEETETGIYLKGADGKLLKDSFGHPVKLSDYVKKEAINWFPVKVQDPKEAPGGDPTPPGGDPPAFDIEKLKGISSEEFLTIWSKTPSEQRSALTAAYEKANNPNWKPPTT